MKVKVMHGTPFLLLAALVATGVAFAANPILPLWEYIPDGEPYVFDDPDNPGKKRVYLYGSHDTSRNAYCGYDYTSSLCRALGKLR